MLTLTKDFLESLDLALLMKSSRQEERDMAMNLCSLLIHHDPKLTMDDLVSFDLQARDLMNKSANNKIWSALNQINTQNRIEMAQLKDEILQMIQ